MANEVVGGIGVSGASEEARRMLRRPEQRRDCFES
ncbi:hypothetical protein [Paraburkholderia aspalathi]|nr:hypothetical protein [Paraburkholderia aspalathi]